MMMMICFRGQLSITLVIYAPIEASPCVGRIWTDTFGGRSGSTTGRHQGTNATLTTQFDDTVTWTCSGSRKTRTQALKAPRTKATNYQESSSFSCTLLWNTSHCKIGVKWLKIIKYTPVMQIGRYLVILKRTHAKRNIPYFTAFWWIWSACCGERCLLNGHRI